MTIMLVIAVMLTHGDFPAGDDRPVDGCGHVYEYRLDPASLPLVLVHIYTLCPVCATPHRCGADCGDCGAEIVEYSEVHP